MSPMSRLFTLMMLIGIASNGWAHKASDSFIYLDESGDGPATVQVDVALRDLALILPMDTNGDRQLTGAEFRAAEPRLLEWIGNGVTVASNGHTCALALQQWGLSRHSDGPYAASRYRIHCDGGASPTTLDYRLLFDRDPLHRALVSHQRPEGEALYVMGPEQTRLDLSTPRPSALQTFGTFLYEGVIHLLIGLDHILFLLLLILPASLATRPGRRTDGTRTGLSFTSQLWQLAGIVTAFTVAHSITLALSAFGVVDLPIGWVELVIALSIIVAAINIYWPILGRKTWKLAFGFGLIHGFGFASVLGDLTAGITQMAVALAGFNLGVEMGQLALLAIAFPLLYLLGGLSLHRRLVAPLAVASITGISLIWVIERAGAL